MARVAQWEKKFAEWMAYAQTRSFRWGVWDCVLGTASAVEAVTGVDHAKDFKGTYRDGVGAGRVLHKRWPGGMEEMLDELFGRAVHPHLCQRGDPVLGLLQNGDQTLMVDGGNVYVRFGKDGSVVVPKDEMFDVTPVKGWAV